MLYESSSKDQKRILWVAISLLIAVSIIVLSLTLWKLYRANFDQRVADLQAMVNTQVSMIGAVARFDREHIGNEVSGGAASATKGQVIDGFSRLGGFGETGEFVLGQRRGDQILFMSEFRFTETNPHRVVPLATDRAAPMRRALSEERGWMVGLDYRGERVLAAFEPIEELNMGLVAKLDMDEVNAPFMKAAATVLGIASVIVFIGGLLILRMAKPMVKRIEEIQKRFRTLLESAPDAMVIIDASGTIVMVNRRTEELFGYSRDEITGQPIELLMPQRFREKHPERIRSFFSNPSARPMGSGLELFGCNKAGLEFAVEISLSPIETEDGTLVASSLRDITERKQAEEELKALNANVEKQRRTEIALNKLSELLRCEQEMGNLASVIVHELAQYLDLQFVALFVLRNGNTYVREGAYSYPSQGGVKKFESGDGLLGQVVADASPLKVDKVPEYAQLALGLGTISPSSLLIYPLVHDETVVAVLELGGLRPLDDAQQDWLGKARESLAVTIRLVLDLEQRNRAEKELAEAKEAAEKANKAKSGFLANMSHELRTPMNAILGYSEMLMEDAADAGQDDFIPDLKKINQAGNHLLSLINDVLDLSKIESGRMEAYAEDIDVGALIDQVAGTAQPLMARNNNQFTIERGEQLGRAHQDITKLRQSLLNMLSNAAKFTHEGSITLHAERKSQASGEWLIFSVSDTGIGIPADKLEHVFEEFSQADSSTTRDYGGTGLGLPISRRFCQMLGGDLTVKSTAGEGSTFTMRVPVQLPGTDTETPAEAAPVKTDAELEVIRVSGVGRTILVIDDDPEAQDIVGRFLRKDGFEVATAGSGEEGLRLAHKLKPAAITLDVMMPDMDGWSVLRALKADPVLKGVPVLMLTMVDDKSKGYSLGATDYLTKPVDRELLHNALARYHVPGESGSVLLVEDDVPTREMMARTLEKSDWTVSEAGNGREALERLAQQKPRLILLDLMMPVMDGFDFLLEMRANAEWQDIPVIVLTAKDLTDEDRRMLSGRVEQIVEKGACAHDQVVDLIHQIIDPPGLRLKNHDMRLLNKISISTKVFSGFGIILLLLLVISTVSLTSLYHADNNFKNYRSLARQTNANGRIQANMLMTRIFAKNFVINASEDNMAGVEQRAKTTIEMIEDARGLTTDRGFQLIIDSLDQELHEYVARFEEVTAKQATRDTLVHDTLNVVGPKMEKNLTAIMESAFADGDAEAEYRAGLTLRNLLLARIYATRFLIQNDNASYQRVAQEFTQMQENLDLLVANLQDEDRLAIAGAVRTDQRIYARAFEEVHSVINSRNDIIGNQLDKIGPRVADKVERLKLAIKALQDELGPRAEAEIDRAVAVTLVVSLASIALAIIAAWLIGFGVSRPIRTMSNNMRELAAGNMDVDVTVDDRRDEIREMAESVQVFKASMVKAYELADEQKKNAEIRIAKEAAEEANRAKSAFLANMSHELRTPMNAILGYSEMLIEEAEDVGQDDFIPDLKKINQAGNHLLSLINDVLDLSKIESGKMEAFAEQFDIGSLIDQASNTAQPLMAKNHNHFKIERGENLGHAFQDVTKVRQSLLNMLSNAAKFTHEGTITLRVDRASYADGEWLTFSVSDTGIGIPADKLDHVFDEFSQADSSTTRDYGGTGLGLTISRRFCQMLGGNMTVTSEPGKGSTFTVRLPAVLPGTKAPQEEPPQPGTNDVHQSDDTTEAKADNTILVIDDNAEAREIIKRFLEKDGFNVVTATSGEDGLRLAHQLQPAAITLDVMMPDMDGWSVLRALKVDPVLHNVPVVMLTMLDDKNKGYALGATDYLTKPIDRDHLHIALARFHTPSEPCSVLLVEDDPATREIMVRTLENAKWQVTEAGNGREALEQLSKQKPRLILLDLMMPVMDGFDFLLEMRANAEWQDIPVIVLTAKDLTEEDRRVLSGRVEQIVEKGACTHEQVVNLVHQVIDSAPANQ